ncbi:hypothetical protein EV356DRAFT_385831 [Viridothelium virens]|uniref:Uncharacterized protein n=1 Tax=Viridothelium virens TaxID=1048519 RepID=A0A6A6GUT8_VIRVR|nr:hypothetical protein EV356DRAFT_385831 [Viridothelium virens]
MSEASDAASDTEPAASSSNADLHEAPNSQAAESQVTKRVDDFTEGWDTALAEPVRKDIIYRIECRDKYKELVGKFESTKPFGNLEIRPNRPAEDVASDDVETGAILEIVTHVRVFQYNSYYPPQPGLVVDGQGDTDLPRFLEDFPISSKQPTEVVVKSQILLNIIRQIVSYYPSQELTGDSITIKEPYPVLMHHLHDLTDLLSQSKEEAMQKSKEWEDPIHDPCHHLQVLLDFLQPTIRKVLRPTQQKLERPVPVVTFDTLWYMYRPGEDLYFKSTRVVGDKIEAGVMTEMSLEPIEDAGKR